VKLLCDLRSSFNAVRNQGRRMTCLSFAASASHERAVGSKELLSVEYLFYHSVMKMPNANPDDGTTLVATKSALSLEGQPLENVWPYEPCQAYGTEWVPPDCANEIYRVEMDLIPPSVDAAKSFLDQNCAVILGLVITDAFYRCDTQGHLPRMQTDMDRAGHAIVAVGHGIDGNSDYLLVRNSWGPEWGLGGHAWLSSEYLGSQMFEMAVVA